MECVVQGIIETQHVEALEVLLEGLCGSNRELVRLHEICLKSGPNLGMVTSEDRAEQLSALVRNVLESQIDNNGLRFFNALGYKLDYELLWVGFRFEFYKVVPIKVSVTSVYKMPKLHAVDEAVPVSPGLQLVDITAPASTDNYAEVVAAIASFAEHLAPLIHLSKPSVTTGVVSTAAAAAASLTSRGQLKAA